MAKRTAEENLEIYKRSRIRYLIELGAAGYGPDRKARQDQLQLCRTEIAVDNLCLKWISEV